MSQKRCHVTLKLDFDENTRIYADYRSKCRFQYNFDIIVFASNFDV